MKNSPLRGNFKSVIVGLFFRYSRTVLSLYKHAIFIGTEKKKEKICQIRRKLVNLQRLYPETDAKAEADGWGYIYGKSVCLTLCSLTL